MNRTKIEWAEYTWNPMTGCEHNCPYCYAELMSKRFCGDVRVNLASPQTKKENGIYILDEIFLNSKGKAIICPYGFAPTFHRYRLSWLDKVKMGANIFVGSLADNFGKWVPDEIITEIFEACRNHPRNNYLFLTKNPNRYMELHEKGLLPDDDNMWYGTSVTDPTMPYCYSGMHNNFLSIEPLLSEFTGDISEDINWVIIGAETGQRRGKIVPKKEWVEYIVQRCDEKNIPVFMKDSLIPIMGEENMRRGLPEQLKTVRPSEKMYSKLYDKCFYCGTEDLMNKMVCLMFKRKRKGPQKKLCYVCEKCFKDKFGIEEKEERNIENQ